MNRDNFQQQEIEQIEQEPQQIGAYKYQSNEAKYPSIDDVLRTFVMDKIEETFENGYVLYHYMVIQMKLQINNDETRTFVTSTHEQILIINLGLHLKGSKDEYLYGIIIMNNIIEQQQPKYLWQIDQFLSVDQIQRKYELDIISSPLPQPSQISYFDIDLNKTDIDRLIDDYNYEQFTLNHCQDIIRNGYKLVIDRAEWIQIFKQSIDNDMSWIPVIINDNDRYQIARTKIIHIPSKDVYVGIQLEQSFLPKKLQQKLNLPEAIVQCIHGYAEELSIVRDPRSICYGSAATSLSKSISLAVMDRYYKQWVTDIKICDLNKELTTIANKHDVNPGYVIKSFQESTGRKGFSFSMKTEHDIRIKQGKALKIYDNLDELDLISSQKDNIELHDFSNHWEQVLKQQSRSQQEILSQMNVNKGASNAEVSDASQDDISISNNNFIEQQLPQTQHVHEEVMRPNIYNQMVQQMMYHFNHDGMQNMNILRDQNQRYQQNNNHQQSYMNDESYMQQTYLY